MGKCLVVQSMTWLRRERSGASGAEAEGASPASSEELRGERRAPSSRSDTQRDFITPLACGCFFYTLPLCEKKKIFFLYRTGTENDAPPRLVGFRVQTWGLQ